MQKWALRKSYTKTGFTIVELLIVVVVIAILAAITIVAYNGITNKAKASAAASAAESAAKKVAVYTISNGDQVPPDLATAGITDQGDTTYQYRTDTTTTPQSFCVTATSSNISYFVNNTTQTTPRAGACPGHGVNGGGTITNLAPNPGAETDLSSITPANNVTVVRATDWSAGGTASFMVTPATASTDSFMSYGGDTGAFRLGFQAGKTYTISATIHLAAAQTGSTGINGNGARVITAWYHNGGSYTRVPSATAPNAPGTTRLSVTFSIPATADAAFVRLYNGAIQGGGAVYFDNILITEGSTSYNYADGNSAGWVWNGAQNNSTSTGPAL